MKQSDFPLAYIMHSHGPAADPVKTLGWVFTGICVFVCLLIALLLVKAIMHKRITADAQTIVHDSGGIGWIIFGSAISIGALFAMAVYMLVTLNAVATPSHAPTLTLTVTGYDWWWKIEYEDDDPARRFITANEIHIPIGSPVRIRLKSMDVIHAFWVPDLAGKTETIPGQINQQWIEADHPGVYLGACTQFCGQQHAHMAMEVVAQRPEEFEAWRKAQLAPTHQKNGTIRGEQIFMEHCSSCHAVRGSSANGIHGPDLTHLGSRHLIAAGMLTNTPDHVMDWVRHAQEIKPGALMPDFPLSPDEASALSAYLSTLN